VCCSKKQEFLLPVDTDQKDLVPLNGHSLKSQSENPQLSTSQLNQLLTNAVHSTMNLYLWHLNGLRTQLNVSM